MNGTTLGILAGVAASAAAGATAYAIRKELDDLEINAFSIGPGSPTSTPLRLLQLSDLHLRRRVGPRYQQLADTVHRLRPDLILLTGDAVDWSGVAPTLDQFLGRLPREVPKAAILGNHDYKSGVRVPAFRQLYARHNGQLLVNESITYHLRGTRLVVTGLDDSYRGMPDLAGAIKDVGAEAHHLMLIHRPLQQEYVRRELARLNAQRPLSGQTYVSYLFAGHTHGGQVQLFGYAPYLPRGSGNYLSGWFNQQPPYLYVSRGFGTSLIPVRWGARPEITLFHYYP